MVEARRPNEVPAVVRNRIRDDDSWIVERLVVLLIAFWLGGLTMVALSATGSFRAVESVMDKPPMAVARAMARIGVAETKDVLYVQSGEVNRQLFEMWGWAQLSLTFANFLALLFMSNAGKRILVLAGAICALAVVLSSALIPSMIRTGRELRAHAGVPSMELRQDFRNMHVAFGAFEAAAAFLGLLLIAALLHRRLTASR